MYLFRALYSLGFDSSCRKRSRNLAAAFSRAARRGFSGAANLIFRGGFADFSHRIFFYPVDKRADRQIAFRRRADVDDFDDAV